MELKKLSVANKEIIKTFFADVFTKEPWNDDWSDKAQLDAYIVDLCGNVNSLTLGFYDDNKMIGLSMGHIKHWYSGTEYYIDELCIKTDCQGKGYGTEFVKQIQKYLLENGISHIFLITDKNVPAFEFYRKNGFVECENGTVALIRDFLNGNDK